MLNEHQVEDRVRDMTIGAGVTLEPSEVVSRLQDDLNRELHPREKRAAIAAARNCLQAMEQP